jgi:RNA polymerase sigma factor (sigma-70 family)
MGLSEDDAADVFQATFLALYRNLDRIEAVATLPKWLTVTATRESYRLMNSRHTKYTANLGETDLDTFLADEDHSVEDQLLLAATGEALRQGLEKLQARCRELLTMLYVEEDISYQAISDRLSLPMGSIGPTRARCLDKLRSLIVKDSFFSEMYQEKSEAALPV